MTERKTYSISVRLRRTIVQEAFVSVPLNNDVIDPTPDENGRHHVDGNKVMEVAVRLGNDLGTQWASESEPKIEPHPIQNPPLWARN